MSSKQIALIRGINVGRAKRLAMADFRALLEKIGYSEVHTILNSGNAVFVSEDTDTAHSSLCIEEAIYKKVGFSAKVMVFTEEELNDIVIDNPLGEIANDPSKLIVMFLQNPQDLIKLRPLEQQQWAPDVLAIGRRAAYLWCSEGILASKLNSAAVRALGEALTARNWSTVIKLENATHMASGK
jgi:uncharacterized protein (DUF1697 family)